MHLSAKNNMTRTEIIKKAINRRVIIEDNDNDSYAGWLVLDPERKGYYDVLPFSRYDEDQPIMCYRVSHIKHIRYINNDYQLW